MSERQLAGDRFSKWIGGMVLSVSCGISAGLLSGSGATGFFMAAFLGVLLTLMIAFSPPAGRGRAPKELYFASVFVLVGPWVLLKLGYEGRRSSGPPVWDLLQERYAAKGPAPGGSVSVGEVVVNRKTGFLLYQPYNLGRASTTLADAGAHLALSFPRSWIWDPVLLPLKSIRECRKNRSSDTTTLALREVALDVELGDQEGHVFKWCQYHELPDGSEPES
jgi:hypothetical protein